MYVVIQLWFWFKNFQNLFEIFVLYMHYCILRQKKFKIKLGRKFSIQDKFKPQHVHVHVR